MKIGDIEVTEEMLRDIAAQYGTAVPYNGALLALIVMWTAMREEVGMTLSETPMFTHRDLVAFGQSEQGRLPEGMTQPVTGSVGSIAATQGLADLVRQGVLSGDANGYRLMSIKVLAPFRAVA